MPTLNIKDEEIHRMAKALAEVNNTSMTEEVRQAIRERYDRIEPKVNPREGLAVWIKKFSKVTATHFKGEDRTRNFDDDLYDEDGLPK